VWAFSEGGSVVNDRTSKTARAPRLTECVTNGRSVRLQDEPVRNVSPSPSPATLADRPDAVLLRLARDGDPLAYDAIVTRYREPLRRACARITAERAEDAVQQALLSAWVALERGADVRELRPWLYSIARNAAIDQSRGVRGDVVELNADVAGGDDPALMQERRYDVHSVLTAVAALPDRQRRALVDTALHGRPASAVAGDLGLSGGALRQLVHRARTTVRAAVPSLSFPFPGWLAHSVGEEGTRSGAALLASGSGAAAMVVKASATAAALGALFACGVSLDAQHAANASSGRTAEPLQRNAVRAASGVMGRAVEPTDRLFASAPLARIAGLRPPVAGAGREETRTRADTSNPSGGHAGGAGNAAQSGSALPERGAGGGGAAAPSAPDASSPSADSEPSRRERGGRGETGRDDGSARGAEPHAADVRGRGDDPNRVAEDAAPSAGSGAAHDEGRGEDANAERGSGRGKDQGSGDSGAGSEPEREAAPPRESDPDSDDSGSGSAGSGSGGASSGSGGQR
jgi:RNA polymerase sigma factor (sigma-70 family)